jgi:hypothetical protein
VIERKQEREQRETRQQAGNRRLPSGRAGDIEFELGDLANHRGWNGMARTSCLGLDGLERALINAEADQNG